jgi:branched-chain amino acid transport system permease protein
MDVIILGVLNGISFGSILFLLGSGLSLILGVMGILNLTHGALYMIAAYVGWSLAVQSKLNFALAVL